MRTTVKALMDLNPDLAQLGPAGSSPLAAGGPVCVAVCTSPPLAARADAAQ